MEVESESESEEVNSSVQCHAYDVMNPPAESKRDLGTGWETNPITKSLRKLAGVTKSEPDLGLGMRMATDDINEELVKSYHVVHTECMFWNTFMPYPTEFTDMRKSHNWRTCTPAIGVKCGVCLECKDYPIRFMCPFMKAVTEVESQFRESCITYKVMCHRALLRARYPFLHPRDDIELRCTFAATVGGPNCPWIGERKDLIRHLQFSHDCQVTKSQSFICTSSFPVTYWIVDYLNEIFIYRKQLDIRSGLFVTVHKMGLTNEEFECNIVMKSFKDGIQADVVSITFALSMGHECLKNLSITKRFLGIKTVHLRHLVNEKYEPVVQVTVKKTWPQTDPSVLEAPFSSTFNSRVLNDLVDSS